MTPSSEADLADAIAGATSPLAIRGGGTRGVAVTGEEVSTAGLSGITLYEPGALTLVAQGGTPLSVIDAALGQEGQMLAFEPMDMRSLLGVTGAPTIGGVVATNASGPRRVQAGACRDFLIGVRFVDGRGTVIKNGGRVMKNVTGYDLARLMCGAHGTLGVLTEVSFKVLPRPDAAGTLMIHGLDVDDAVDLMARALTSPFEVSGAAFVAGPGEAARAVFLRIEGFETQVAHRLDRLQALLQPHLPEGAEFETAATRSVDEVARQWAAIRDQTAFAGTADDIWRVVITPSDAPHAVRCLPDGANYALDWGGGLLWAYVAQGTDLRALLSKVRGHATLVKGVGARFPCEGPVLSDMGARLRAEFDPRGILNAGVMG